MLRRKMALAVLGVIVLGSMLGLYGASDAAVPKAQEPFANSVEQRAETVAQLREIATLLREQNDLLRQQSELLRSGQLQVVVTAVK